MITLRLHDCYSPFVKIFSKEHWDKSGVKYYRAVFQNSDFEKFGFIVRQDFFIWSRNYGIYEMNLLLSDKGASLISYSTFKEIKSSEGVRFIEMSGVYISGNFSIKNYAQKKIEKICFVPAYPNRFSLSSIKMQSEFYNADYKFCPDDSYRLRLCTQREVHLIIGDGAYTERYLEFVENIIEYIAVFKTDYYEDWDEYVEAYGPVAGEYKVIFHSYQNFVSSINDANNLKLKVDDIIFKSITSNLEKLREQIPFMRRIKSVVQSQNLHKLKLEMQLSLDDLNDDFKLLISKIGGTKFDINHLGLGSEFGDEYYESIGEIYDKKKPEVCEIKIVIILQV